MDRNTTDKIIIKNPKNVIIEYVFQGENKKDVRRMPLSIKSIENGEECSFGKQCQDCMVTISSFIKRMQKQGYKLKERILINGITR